MGDVAAARYPHHGRIFATQFSVFIGIPFTLLIFKVWRIMHPSIWLPLDWCAKILFAPPHSSRSGVLVCLQQGLPENGTTTTVYIYGFTLICFGLLKSWVGLSHPWEFSGTRIPQVPGRC